MAHCETALPCSKTFFMKKKKKKKNSNNNNIFINFKITYASRSTFEGLSKMHVKN